LKEIFEAVPGRYGALKAPRLNFVPSAEEKGLFWERMTLLEMQSLKWWKGEPRRRPLSPKMAHRGSPSVVVGHGNHDVRPKSEFERVPGWQPILIFHYPLRSYAQFERKVAMMASTEGRKAPERARLYRLYEEGRLRDYWESHLRPDDEVEEGVARGELCRETRLRDRIAQVYGRDVSRDPGSGLALEMCWSIEVGRRARRERRGLKSEIAKLTARLDRANRRHEALAERVAATRWQRARGQLSRLRSSRP
jgi:hypothetical protein